MSEKKLEKTPEKNAPQKKKHTKLKILAATIAIIVIGGSLFLQIALQERKADPIGIDPAVLSQQGWAQTGDLYKGSGNFTYIVTVKINTAALTYIDTRLSDQINAEKNRLVDEYKARYPRQAQSIKITDISMGKTSRLMTTRIMAPMGADFVSGQATTMVSDMLASEFGTMMAKNGISNFRKTGEMQLTIKGRTVTAGVYEGSFDLRLGGNVTSVNLKGLLAVWADTGIVAVSGAAVSGRLSCDYKVAGIVIPFSFDFDKSGAGGISEFDELVTLVQNTS